MPAPGLAELQRLFWRSLARTSSVDERATLEPALVDVVTPSATLAPAERLDIYARMYLARIREALHEDFPRLAAALGDEGFDGLVRAYLGRHPSQHPSLRHAGRWLPEFVEHGDWPGARACAPFLADLARLEWARIEAFDASDVTPVRPDDLRGVAPERWPALRFVLVPSFTVVRSRWPIHRIWQGTGAHEPEPTAVRVWREGWTVYHAAMEADEDRLLTRLAAGAPFSVACEVLGDADDQEAAARAGGLLARWLADGLVAAAETVVTPTPL